MEESFNLLDCVNSVPGEKHGYYRISVGEDNIIKYLRFYDNKKTCIPDFRGHRLSFDKVPEGRWNCANLSIDVGQHHELVIDSCVNVRLPSIETWHPVRIDISDLSAALFGHAENEPLCHNKVYAAVHPDPLQNSGVPHQYQKSTDVCSYDAVVFFHHCWWPSDVAGPAWETQYHKLINHWRPDLAIAPKFLAHVTENHDRVIGYITEYVPGRIAQPRDLNACRETVKKLHAMGVVYGASEAESFLVPDDTKRGLLLHSFGKAFRSNDPKAFELEMNDLNMVLETGARKRRAEARSKI